MDKFIAELIDKWMENPKDKSRNILAQADSIYQNDLNDKKELERRYESLTLTREQRMVINDYIACSLTASQRYADLSYIAGIKDIIEILVSSRHTKKKRNKRTR